MRMDRVQQRIHGGLGFHGQHALADQLESLRTDDVNAQDLAIGFLGDDLDEAVVLPQNRRLTVGRERKLADLDFMSLGPRLRLRQADAADSWLGISRAGNAAPY